MNIKIDIKNKILWEKEKYSQFACFSKHASRQNPEPIELGLPFEIDRNKIIIKCHNKRTSKKRLQ